MGWKIIDEKKIFDPSRMKQSRKQQLQSPNHVISVSEEYAYINQLKWYHYHYSGALSSFSF
jgi:hypothetical protein